METCDPLNLEPFDPSTFSKTVGETYVMEGGKGALIQGRTKRKVGWKPLEIESIKPRATPPSLSLHRWLDRSKDSPPKMEEINVQSFSIRIDFRWNKIWYDLKNLNWELFTREAMINSV